LGREVFGLQQIVFDQLFVNTLGSSFGQHHRGYVESDNVFKALLGKVLANQAGATADVEDSDLVLVEASLLCVFCTLLCHFYRIRIA